MITNRLGYLLAVALAISMVSLQGAKPDKELEGEAQVAKEVFLGRDKEMTKLFEGASGYVIFPKVAKGAMGIGAAKGKGILFVKDEAIGEASLTQVTIGFQLGGQVYSELIFFENERALENFKEGKVEMSAQVSAVAAAEGASQNAKYRQGLMVFTVAQGGLMYEASVGGQKFKFKPYKK